MKTITFAGMILAVTVAASAQTVTSTTTHTSTNTNGVISTVTSQHGNANMVRVSSGATDPIPKDDIFAGTEIFEKNATDVTEINMGPDGLGKVGGTSRHAAQGMLLNIVRTYGYDKPGLYNIADVEVYRKKLNTGDWHCTVHSRNLKTGESSDICNKSRTDGYREQAIITVEPKELTFIHQIMKDGGDHGDGAAMMFDGHMPLIAGLNPGDMARMQAQLAVMGATMGATMQPKIDMEIENQLDGLPDVKLLPKPKAGQMMLKMKRAPGSANPPKEFFLETTPDDAQAVGQKQKVMKDFKIEVRPDGAADTLVVTPDAPADAIKVVPDAPAPEPAPAAPSDIPAPAPAPAAPQQ